MKILTCQVFTWWPSSGFRVTCFTVCCPSDVRNMLRWWQVKAMFSLSYLNLCCVLAAFFAHQKCNRAAAHFHRGYFLSVNEAGGCFDIIFICFLQRMKYQSYRRQSAPSLVITKALTRSKTLSRYCTITDCKYSGAPGITPVRRIGSTW